LMVLEKLADLGSPLVHEGTRPHLIDCKVGADLDRG